MPCWKPVLRQIEWGSRLGEYKMDISQRTSTSTLSFSTYVIFYFFTFFFENFVSVYEPLIKSWFDA